MLNKYYLIISLAIIFFIGSYSIFNAGYEQKPEELKDEEKTVIESVNEEEERKESLKNNEPRRRESEKIEVETEEGKMNEDQSNKSLTNLVEKISPHPENRVKCTRLVKGIPSPKAIEYHPDGK